MPTYHRYDFISKRLKEVTDLNGNEYKIFLWRGKNAMKYVLIISSMIINNSGINSK